MKDLRACARGHLLPGRRRGCRIANDSPFGLQAHVFSSNPQRAHQVTERIEAGTVLVSRIFDDSEAPFGGMQQPEIGRHHHRYGLVSYLKTRAITA
ncbi:aldehyde dehydrogenase family protein [Streptomyces sp. SS1-1]|uniref:aldehyde dehydrogenase family protein n=1 Tax=Streptomyces sp. SS1-1 TaxID=2651869 RepID=UPI001CEF9B46